MRYDDATRPHSDGALPTALQTNGSPLPAISLIRPMETEERESYKVCSGRDGCTGMHTGSDEGCAACAEEHAVVWGWLCAIHAHKGENRFGTYYAVLRDLGAFQRDFMENPEAALLRYFKYDGPHYEPTANSPRAPREQATEEDIFA